LRDLLARQRVSFDSALIIGFVGPRIGYAVILGWNHAFQDSTRREPRWRPLCHRVFFFAGSPNRTTVPDVFMLRHGIVGSGLVGPPLVAERLAQRTGVEGPSRALTFAFAFVV
jgi:hypothetical protein